MTETPSASRSQADSRSPSSGKRRGLPSRVRMRHDTHFVDELSKRSEPSVGRMIALSEVEPDPHQPREAMGNLEELVRSVEEKGVLEPILVRRRPDPGDETGEDSRGDGIVYRIISGERRYHAALEAGMIEIPAIEMDVDESEALEIALIENLQRKDLTPFEEAEGYRALATQHDYTHEQIAKSVGKGRVSVTESLSLLSMPPRVRDAVRALGIETKSILLEVMKASDEEEMIRLLERVASLGLNRDDLRREVKRSGSKPKKRRRKPYTFKFQAPDKRYSFSLSFRQSAVDHDDLVEALQEILDQLREIDAAEDRERLAGASS